MLDMLSENFWFFPVVVIILWIALVSPFKSAVRRRAGRELYAEIAARYREMKRDRAFGAAGIAIGLTSGIALSSLASTGDLPGLEDSGVISLLFVLAGMYCYLMGFVKAMADVMGERRKR